MSDLSIPINIRRFQEAMRRQESLMAPLERPCLRWLAERLPENIGSDHLTLLGFAALFLAGASYAAAARWPQALLLVNVWLAMNWFGDSLDGTVARLRKRPRPRYGFYVDHMADSFGALFLMGGLAVSGFASERVALALLVSFLLLSINSYLAAHTRGTFQLSLWGFSPTEIRILLALGNIVAFWRPQVTIFGVSARFFDIAGIPAGAAMAIVLLASVVQNTAALYREEALNDGTAKTSARN